MDLNKLRKATESNAAESGSQNLEEGRLPIIYPFIKGAVVAIRPIYDRNTETLMRVIKRYENAVSVDYKFPDISYHYGIEDPVSSAISEVRAINPRAELPRIRKRAILYGAVTSTNRTITYGSDQSVLQPNQPVLIMVPMTVFGIINDLISKVINDENGDIESLINSNEGNPIQVSVDNDYNYSIEVLEDKVKLFSEDSQYDDLVSGLASINDSLVPEKVTEAIMNTVKSEATAIRARFMNPNTYPGSHNGFGQPYGANNQFNQPNPYQQPTNPYQQANPYQQQQPTNPYPNQYQQPYGVPSPNQSAQSFGGQPTYNQPSQSSTDPFGNQGAGQGVQQPQSQPSQPNQNQQSNQAPVNQPVFGGNQVGNSPSASTDPFGGEEASYLNTEPMNTNPFQDNSSTDPFGGGNR